MTEAGITSSPVIPAPSGPAGLRGHAFAPLSRLRQGSASSRRALLAVAAVATAVMVGVITRPDTVQNNDGVAAAGPVVESQLKSAETVPDEPQSLESSLSAAADEPRTSFDDSTSTVISEEARSKTAVRDSCFGDSSADALQCGYPMADYGTKHDKWQSMPAIEAEPNAEDVYLPMTVSVDRPRQSSTFVEKSRFIAQFDTTIRVSNPHDSDSTFGAPVEISQELLVDTQWFTCEILDADSTPWLGSISGSHSDLTSLRAGETATRTVAARCTLDSATNPYGALTPRTLVSVADQGALLFRTP